MPAFVTELCGYKTAGIYYGPKNENEFEVKNCTISNHDGIGYAIMDDETPKIPINGNTFSSNTVGIYLKQPSEVNIKKNTFENNKMHDIYCDKITVDLTIKNNTFLTVNASKGIVIQESDDPITLTKNRFAGYQNSNHYAVFVVELIGGITGFSFIDAENNYWDDPKGPNDLAALGNDGDYNTSPKGNYVNDGVHYKPYLKK